MFRASALGLAILAAGCSEPRTGRVRGVVSVDGKPAKTGSIAFFPVEGRGVTAGGAINEGKYAVEAALGKVKVEIRVPKVVGEEKAYDTPDSAMKQITEEALPAKYNDETELRIEVTPGEMTKDFDLSTK
jgi:hypothetical protein